VWFKPFSSAFVFNFRIFEFGYKVKKVCESGWKGYCGQCLYVLYINLIGSIITIAMVSNKVSEFSLTLGRI
jgi:hypothetical protein